MLSFTANTQATKKRTKTTLHVLWCCLNLCSPVLCTLYSHSITLCQEDSHSFPASAIPVLLGVTFTAEDTLLRISFSLVESVAWLNNWLLSVFSPHILWEGLMRTHAASVNMTAFTDACQPSTVTLPTCTVQYHHVC